jgi:heme exporter protein D
LISGRGRVFSPEIHSAFYSMGNWGPFTWDKAAGTYIEVMGYLHSPIRLHSVMVHQAEAQLCIPVPGNVTAPQFRTPTLSGASVLYTTKIRTVTMLLLLIVGTIMMA